MQAEKPDTAVSRGRGAVRALGPAVAMLLQAGLCLAAAPGGTGPAAPDADPALGRLFMTPAQRDELDARRVSGGAAPANAAPVPEQAAPERILLSGILTRSAGPDVVWINGERARPATGPVQVRRGPDAARRVTIADPAAGTTARLKPGQVWTPRNGRVSDCFDCATPRVTADPAEVPSPGGEPATAEKSGEAATGTSPVPAPAPTGTAAETPTTGTAPPPAGQP